MIFKPGSNQLLSNCVIYFRQFSTIKAKFLIVVVVSHCQRGNSVALVNVLIKHLFRINFHMAFLDGAVSHLPVELPRTLKGQSGVEFDF